MPKSTDEKMFLDLVKDSQIYIPLLELVAKYIPKDVKGFLSNEPNLISKLSKEDKLGEELKGIVDDLKNVQDNLQKEKVA